MQKAQNERDDEDVIAVAVKRSQFVSMKRSQSDKKSLEVAALSDSEDYPYGLRVDLDDDALDNRYRRGRPAADTHNSGSSSLSGHQIPNAPVTLSNSALTRKFFSSRSALAEVDRQSSEWSFARLSLSRSYQAS
jgi:hypothetical protein